MAVEVFEDGTVEIRTTIRLRKGRDSEIIPYFVPEPLNVAGTMRELMRNGTRDDFIKADQEEEKKINLDIGIEV